MSNNYSNRDSNKNKGGRPPYQQQRSPEERAQDYLPDIMLLFENKPSTDSIKKAIKQIETMVKVINTQREKMTTHQIRNIYKLVKDAKNNTELNLLRPRLAYISARQKDEQGKVIAKVIDEIIIKITDGAGEDKNGEKKKTLDYIMESIVAYHKFHVKE